MNPMHLEVARSHPDPPNGAGAAAILAAGLGCFALALLAMAGDSSPLLKNLFVFYRPTGPLSGVTTIAVLFWLFTWAALEHRWKKRTVALRRISLVAFALLGLSLLLTCPPVADLF